VSHLTKNNETKASQSRDLDFQKYRNHMKLNNILDLVLLLL